MNNYEKIKIFLYGMSVMCAVIIGRSALFYFIKDEPIKSWEFANLLSFLIVGILIYALALFFKKST